MERTLTALRPHPENTKIYGDHADDTLIQSIQSRGVLTPLLITKSDIIISGHRRWDAAKAAGLASVPVTIFQSTDELDILEALIESNRQRAKDNEQIGREFEAIIGIETERAEQRQKATQLAGKDKNGTPKKASVRDSNPAPKADDSNPTSKKPEQRARDEAGKKTGTGGKKAEQARFAVQVMDALIARGKRTEAQQLKQLLKRNAFKAWKLAKSLEPLTKPSAAPAPVILKPEKYITLDYWETLDDAAQRAVIANAPRKSKEGMNEQKTDFIEWAQWSWNPVVGCLHNCPYCISGDTLILMADGSTKLLVDIEVGDEIIGTRKGDTYRHYTTTRVLAHWKSYKHAYRITLADGTQITASADHRFLSRRRKWKHTIESEHGRSRRPHLTTNDSLMGIGKFIETPPETAEYRRGYLSGMIRGDGHLAHYQYDRVGRQHGNQHQFRLALTDTEGLATTSGYLSSFGVETAPFVFSETMAGIRTHASESVAIIEDLIEYEDTSEYLRGFLAGIFDAEGTGGNPQSVFRICNADPEILATIEKGVRLFGFDYVFDMPKQHAPTGKVVHTIRIRGGLKEHVRFFQLTNPSIRRKLHIEGAAVKTEADLRVIEIEDLGVEMPMYDITTGTEDFIANGVIAHNCYARDIAETLYPHKFAPAFVPSRLFTPRNIKVPAGAETNIGLKNIFTCSMADLFGKWVPTAWIEAVLDVVRACPQWNFLFLTKFPLRLAEFAFPDNAWVGTSVDCQARVANAEDAFRRVQASVKWLSCEPLLENLEFTSLSMFQWVVIGGASKSEQTPEFKPPRSWIINLWTQARDAGCKVYEKTNLLERLREYPGQRDDVRPENVTKEFHYALLSPK